MKDSMNVVKENSENSTESSIKNFLNKFFFLYLILYSGGSIWFFRSEYGFFSLFFGAVLLLMINRLECSNKFFISIGVWLIYFICATIAIGSFHPFFMMEIPITMLCAYVIIQIFHEQCIDLFVTIIYYLSIISLVFYALQLLIPQVLMPILYVANLQGDLFSADYQNCGSILIYSYNIIYGSQLIRNSGFCWEPGAFACFCVVAFYLNFFVRGKKFTRINWILVAGVVSTFSTTGYFLLFGIGIVYFFLYKNLFSKVIVIPLIISFAYIIKHSEFMLEKTSQQYQDAVTWSELIDDSIAYNRHYKPGRFLSLRLAWEDFKLRPLFGFAGNASLNYASQQGASVAIISGLGTMLARYGIWGVFSWLFLLYLSGCFLDKYKKEPLYKLRFVWMLLNIGIAISYKLLFSPVFFIFMFLPLFIPKKFKTSKNIVLRGEVAIRQKKINCPEK